MTNTTTTCLRLALIVPLLGASACDRNQGVGVINLVTRTAADGTELAPMPSCVIVGEPGLSVGGGSLSADFATDMLTMNGEITQRYFIAAEGAHPEAFVTPDNGELAAEIEADMEFFESGETKNAMFEDYDGVRYEAFMWGEDDCEGELPFEPPAGS